MEAMPEAELLARCHRGDAAAWDVVFDRHYYAVGRFVFQLYPQLSHEDTEEICQEVFLSMIKNLGSFQGNSQLQTWLFRIAANKARDLRDRQMAAKRGGGQVTVSLNEEPASGAPPLDPPSTAPGPDAVLVSGESAELLRAALDRLGEPCREIIELRYFGDLSYEEISAALKLNAKTVSSRLSKCLDKLEAIARPLFSAGKNPFSPSNPRV
jgi:RNA polymerase sigma-70 factor (ECF subfamily)